MQQVEGAPTLAMTAGQTAAAPAAAAAAPAVTGGYDAAAGSADVLQQQQQQEQRRPHPQQPAPQSRRQQQQQDAPQQQQHQHDLQQQQQQHPGNAPSWLQNVNVSVAQLLGSIGLTQYVPLLEQQQVDMAALELMEERHLRELGLPIGAVVKIRAALAARTPPAQ